MNQECQIQVIIIKPRITVAFVRVYHVRYFFCKREIIFEVSASVGSLFSGDRYSRDLLTPVTFYRSFRK